MRLDNSPCNHLVIDADDLSQSGNHVKVRWGTLLLFEATLDDANSAISRQRTEEDNRRNSAAVQNLEQAADFQAARRGFNQPLIGEMLAKALEDACEFGV